MTPLVKEMVSLDPEVALSCIWFDLGTLPRYTFAWSELTGNRLPFEKCAIVGRDSKGDKFLVWAAQGDETTILLFACAMMPDHWTRTPVFAVVMAEGGCRIGDVEGEEEITKDQAAPIVGVLAEFLKAANPTGYRATEKANSITNKRRAAKGKAPLIYDWHTVVIEPAKPSGECLGGTHASPRQHERRGHWRTCANGKRVWVRHCTVGDASRGTVFKDYKVSDGGTAMPANAQVTGAAASSPRPVD